MLFGVVVLLVAALALLISRCGSSSKHSSSESSASDKQTIPVVSFLIIAESDKPGAIHKPNGRHDYTVAGSTCSGAGDFVASVAGATVVIQDSAGVELGRTTLASGVATEAGCTFSTVGPVSVARAEAYVIVFPGDERSRPYTIPQLEMESGTPLFGVASSS